MSFAGCSAHVGEQSRARQRRGVCLCVRACVVLCVSSGIHMHTSTYVHPSVHAYKHAHAHSKKSTHAPHHTHTDTYACARARTHTHEERQENGMTKGCGSAAPCAGNAAQERGAVSSLRLGRCVVCMCACARLLPWLVCVRLLPSLVCVCVCVWCVLAQVPRPLSLGAHVWMARAGSSHGGTAWRQRGGLLRHIHPQAARAPKSLLSCCP